MEYLTKKILSVWIQWQEIENQILSCHRKKDNYEKITGYSEKYVADVNGIDGSTVASKNNKIVNLVFTFAGQKPDTMFGDEINRFQGM